jgi:hypothetical protein
VFANFAPGGMLHVIPVTMHSKGTPAALANNVMVELHLDEDESACEDIMSYFSHIFASFANIFC